MGKRTERRTAYIFRLVSLTPQGDNKPCTWHTRTKHKSVCVSVGVCLRGWMVWQRSMHVPLCVECVYVHKFKNVVA